MNNKQLIEEYVRRNNKEYNENLIYNKCVEDMSKIDLQSITEQDVDQVIKRFLIKWGRMQRVLGEKKTPKWKNRLANLIQVNSQRLNDLKIVDLSDVELGKYETVIKDCYDSFKEVVKRVAAAKVLHLICPNFFPPWDDSIIRAISEEIKKEYGIKLNVENCSGDDYYRFMQEIQNFIRKYEGLLSVLAREHGKTKVKIVDDCFWYATQRPLLLFFEGK